MHELSIAEELLGIIVDKAEKAGVRKVVEVNLRIGDYSGILPEALEFAFQVLSHGKITDGAHLNIERTKPLFTCRSCGNEGAQGESSCPRCGGVEMKLTSGDQLEILSFEGE
jgi:hydrogenase nickel incorporation protein HypA/HybF